MSSPVAAAPRTPRRPVRMPLWDNARFVAITLVVMGHAILKLIAESDPAYGVYLFIYAFHVPVFVAVAGYFAKATPPGVKQLKKLVTDLALPYLIFEVIWTVIRALVTGRFNPDLATPSWTLWFLLALIIWRVALPYLALLRFPLVIAVVISVASGYLPAVGSVFALDRTLALLPFFVLGWKLRMLPVTTLWTELPLRRVWWWRAGAIGVFAALALVIATNVPLWRELKVRRVLLFEEAYPEFGYDQWWAGGLRLAAIALAVLLVFSFLVLMPRRATWISPLGQATLYVYLLHSFVLYPLRESGWLDVPRDDLLLVGMILFSILLTLALSSRPVRRVFRPLVEPRAEWLFARGDEKVTPRVGAD
ncbi:acyltransferase family protein [Herbiconiux sp. KACC 21604]|uniref:acyltransferase family protein n=1 Tax=unclassified Herbiconiux TaxID=2618217 RepID=UPI0014920699|nr:acyltransferase family protein [Herbiconiux sp. SALV-R1]QJU53812.1 acyltransferase family protein [Herbiconiux sp. SALV-R1]WPO84821.1 acyltransferase family protein [Herbiconiux sp. KACC 21604]